MDLSTQPVSSCGCKSSVSPEHRRNFITSALAVAGGGLALAGPAIAGLAAFLNPLRGKTGAGKFVRVASLDTLPEDGSPQPVSVVADRTDAWNRFPNEPIGALYLKRTGPGEVEALSVVCPHAGCSVQYEPAEKKFFCPCHGASFDLAGKRLDETSPSPRGLDTLETEVRGNEVWVRYQSFRAGIAEKVEEA